MNKVRIAEEILHVAKAIVAKVFEMPVKASDIGRLSNWSQDYDSYYLTIKGYGGGRYQYVITGGWKEEVGGPDGFRVEWHTPRSGVGIDHSGKEIRLTRSGKWWFSDVNDALRVVVKHFRKWASEQEEKVLEGPLWDRLDASDQRRFKQLERAYRKWGSGPYIELEVAEDIGADPELVYSNQDYSDSYYRQWKDKKSGELFWDFLEG
jgi:hypothetical protein